MVKPPSFAYSGKLLRVNLSSNSMVEETLDELFCRKYLGGAGFAWYFLHKELRQGIDPLSADNKLVLMTLLSIIT